MKNPLTNGLPGNFDIRKHYRYILDKHLFENPESSELEMVRKEVAFYRNHIDEYREHEITDSFPLEALESALEEKDNYLQYFEDKLQTLELEDKIDSFNESTDLSAAKKMIYLHELGVLEHINSRFKVGGSHNTMAKVLSPIMGEQRSTIQPLIGMILSDINTLNPKNPYSTRKNVDDIQEILTRYGFKSKSE